MASKLAWVALLGLWVATFMWLGDIERRQVRNGLMDDLRWKAQLEAFGLHAEAINKTMDLTLRQYRNRWRTS